MCTQMRYPCWTCYFTREVVITLEVKSSFSHPLLCLHSIWCAGRRRSLLQRCCGLCAIWARFVVVICIISQIPLCLCIFSFYFFFYLTKIYVSVQHYDRRGQYDIALEKIEEAIKHTPTLIDLYSVKVC